MPSVDADGLHLKGAASHRDKYEFILRRAADLPNAMWLLDHTLLDILIVGTDGKHARSWLRPHHRPAQRTLVIRSE